MLRSRTAIFILAAWFLATIAGPVAACAPTGERMPGGTKCCCGGGAAAGASRQDSHALTADADPCGCAMTPGAPATDSENHRFVLPVSAVAIRPAAAPILRLPQVCAVTPSCTPPGGALLPHLLPLAPDAGRAPPFA